MAKASHVDRKIIKKGWAVGRAKRVNAAPRKETKCERKRRSQVVYFWEPRCCRIADVGRSVAASGRRERDDGIYLVLRRGGVTCTPARQMRFKDRRKVSGPSKKKREKLAMTTSAEGKKATSLGSAGVPSDQPVLERE